MLVINGNINWFYWSINQSVKYIILLNIIFQ